MSDRLEVLRVFEREPHKTFSTTTLVELVYPREMRSLREQLQFGSKEQKRISQVRKSKLHRKLLYYLGKLIEEDVLAIDRVDAHGEKIYRLSRPSVAANSSAGTIEIVQRPLKTHYVESELDDRTVHLFEQESLLSRYNAFYLDCTSLGGLGHATELLETCLKVVNDVVCLGNFEYLLSRYKLDDLEDFLNTLTLLTLDEARTVCLTLDTRAAAVSQFVQLYAKMLPKRVILVLITDHKSALNQDVADAIAPLQERREKVNIHFWPLHPYPLFLGRAGPYGVQETEWLTYQQQLKGKVPGFVVSQASLLLDLQKLEKTPAHEVRSLILRCAKTLYSLASQQRTSNTGIAVLSTINPDTRLFFLCTTNYLRLWNHDWEAGPLIIESAKEDLEKFKAAQQSIYRSCGIAFHFNLQLSSAFTKFTEELSSRSYRKWMVTTPADYQSASFKLYKEQRAAYIQQFGNVERFRIFRSGNPAAEQVAREALQLGQAGVSLLTVDFKPLQGVKRLTEYFS